MRTFARFSPGPSPDSSIFGLAPANRSVQHHFRSGGLGLYRAAGQKSFVNRASGGITLYAAGALDCNQHRSSERSFDRVKPLGPALFRAFPRNPFKSRSLGQRKNFAFPRLGFADNSFSRRTMELPLVSAASGIAKKFARQIALISVQFLPAKIRFRNRINHLLII